MDHTDYYSDLKYCSKCDKYVTYLMGVEHSYCTECGNRSEVVQSMADDSLTICEICGGPLRKVFHPAGIMFKGSGFYATDNRKSKTPKVEGSTSDLIDKGKKEAEKRGVDVGGKKDKDSGSSEKSGGGGGGGGDGKPKTDKPSEPAKSSSSSKPAKEKSA
jgi:putative FmdB family regulatory protein